MKNELPIIEEKFQSVAIGDDFQVIRENIQSSHRDYIYNSKYTREAYFIQISDKFNELKSKWLEDTSFLSNIDEKTNHIAYKEIISFGLDILPFIIDDLIENQNHWFYALETITGINPILNGDEGNIPAMTEAWSNWAEENNLI